MPAFRLLIDPLASLRQEGPAQAPFVPSLFPEFAQAASIPLSGEAIDVYDFESKAISPDLRAAILRVNREGRTAVAVARRRWRAAFFDMDSTVIQQESIVELARAAGKEREVAAITERAMAGELDFAAALRARVMMLRGIPASVFTEVATRLTINPGMRAYSRWAKQEGIKLYLISGGFNRLAQVIAEELAFDGFSANELEEQEGTLSGHLKGPVVDAEAKAGFMLRTCQELGINTQDAIAVGDGANDLPLLRLAGAAIGYHPKAVLLPHISGANFHDHGLLIHL